MIERDYNVALEQLGNIECLIESAEETCPIQPGEAQRFASRYIDDLQNAHREKSKNARIIKSHLDIANMELDEISKEYSRVQKIESAESKI